MNGSKTLLIVVAVLVVAGVAYLVARTPAPPTNLEPIPIDTTPGTVRQPGSPTVTTKEASFVTQSTAVVNGEVNPNGVQTSYWYEYGTTNSLGRSSGAQLIGGGYVTYSAPAALSGLQSNTTHFYRMVAENQYGKVFGGILSFKTTTATTPPPPQVSPTVETRSVAGVGETGATLQGAVNPRGSSASYWFEYGEAPSLGNTTSVKSAGSGSSLIAVGTDISGLKQNTTYYFRLNAQNPYGTVTGHILSFTTKAKNPPPSQGESPGVSTQSATNIGTTTATLTGQVDPNGSATTYRFEYGRSTLFGLFTLDKQTEVKSAGSGNASIAVTSNISGLEAGSTYYYRIVATNENGTSSGGIFSFTAQRP